MKQPTATFDSPNTPISTVEGPQGRFRVRAGDLVVVDDPHESREFLAEVTGFYKLGRAVFAQLGPAPAIPLGAIAPRRSTKVRNITKAWRRANRNRNGGKDANVANGE